MKTEPHHSATLTPVWISKIARGEMKFPSVRLGMHGMIPLTHLGSPEIGQVVRCFNPRAAEVWVLDTATDQQTTMTRVHPDGVFEAVFPNVEAFDYRLIERDLKGNMKTLFDPYQSRFRSLLKPDDVALFGKGVHWSVYEILGGRLAANDGVEGVNFTVWAPVAKYVSVTGVFNGWNLKAHPMNFVNSGKGIWELFIPGLKAGAMYKFVIRSRKGKTFVKSDPYAYSSQLRPKKSSIVRDIDSYSWRDADWIAKRMQKQSTSAAISVYEVHLGSWIRKAEADPDCPGPWGEGDSSTHTSFYNYREIADDLVAYVKDMGFTHIQLMPVTEHPLDQSWGYQVTSYFAPTSRFGTPDDFMYFVDHCHANDIGVIIDWVPAHFPRDPHGLGRFDGTHLYEHSDPRQGFHPDWKTSIFNFGRHEVRNFLLASALFWIEKYHVDGLRVDAVASMLYLDYSRKRGQWVKNRYGGNENLEAIEFLKNLNTVVHERNPGVITIAEESTAWNGVCRPCDAGGLGFTYKWNMGWMNDSLEYLALDPIHRKYHQSKLTFMLHYAFSEKYMLVLSHDEVVHGKCSLIRKMPGDSWQKFANLRLLFGFMFGHPGKKTLFMGNEFAQFREWSESRELDWYLLDHQANLKIQYYVRDLNRLYRNNRALHENELDARNFQWIDYQDAANSVISFLRLGHDGKEVLLFVFNFTPEPRSGYNVGVPFAGFYREIFNSDAEVYGGSNLGNHPGLRSSPGSCQARDHLVTLTLPPLAMSVFRYEGL